LAADHAPLDLQKLGAVDPAAYDSLHFQLHPTLRLFESRYPILRIWEANIDDRTEPELIDLDSGFDCLGIMRQSLELRFHRLSRGEHGFLHALEQGENFAAALDIGNAGDAEFAAGVVLRRFVAAAVIVDFTS
jgi:hypothetical protein